MRETLDEVVEPIIYAEALELIEQHHASGDKTYLVSASPEEIVQPLAEYLGVDGAIASRAVVDLDGRYTGEMAFYAYGPFKAEAIRDAGHRSRGSTSTRRTPTRDSYTDVPMLEAVGPPRGRQPRPGAGPPGSRPRLGDRCSSPDRSGSATAFRSPTFRRPRPSLDRRGVRGHAVLAVALRQTVRAQGGRATLRRDQASRSRLAAMRPRPTRMARISSFFTSGILPTALGAHRVLWR